MKVPKEHQNSCTVCWQMFDMRNLSQVFAHEDCDGTHKNYDSVEQIPHTSAQKIGKPTLHTKKCGDIGLN